MLAASGPAISTAYGVPRSTLRTWAERGIITRLGTGLDGAALYDVAEVEARLDRPAAGCASLGCLDPARPGAPVRLCAAHLEEVGAWLGAR